MNLWLWFVILVPSVVLHEVAHGYVAYLFGDPTAKERHRLTLNPLSHIDLFGTILLPALLLLTHNPAFGYAKPVPVTVSRLRKPRKQMLWVALSGPAVNILLSAVGLLICRLTIGTGFNALGQIVQYPKDPNLFEFGEYLGIVNLILAVFNLIPVPPLDGSAIIERFVPSRHLASYYRLRVWSMPLVIVLVIVLFRLTTIGSSWLFHLENGWYDLL
jgi:Zn-dependent protease